MFGHAEECLGPSRVGLVNCEKRCIQLRDSLQTYLLFHYAIVDLTEVY